LAEQIHIVLAYSSQQCTGSQTACQYKAHLPCTSWSRLSLEIAGSFV